MHFFAQWRASVALAMGLTLTGCYLAHGPGADALHDGAVADGAVDDVAVADGAVANRDTGSGDGGRPGDGGDAPCLPGDPLSWTVERSNLGGDYNRAVAATSDVPWIAAREEEGNLVFLRLDVDASGLVITERVELPDTPLYPVGFDTDGERFVAVLTSDGNWSGVVETLWYDRASGELRRALWDALESDSRFSVAGGAALVGPHAVFAAARADHELVVELRSASSAIIASALGGEETYTARLARTADDAVTVFADSTGRFHVTPRGIERDDVEPGAYQVIGGLGEFVVEHDRDFRIRGAGGLWSGPWPHTQVSPPAVLRSGGGRIAFSLQKELSGAVGFTFGDRLEWIHVEGAFGARGAGFAVLPIVQERRLGLVYIGLEIPSSEQPLRYFGVACE